MPSEPPRPLRVERDGEAWTFDRPFTVGRVAACDVALDDAHVSRRHLEVVPRGTSWRLVDAGSANGTFVGAERVTEAQIDGTLDVQVGKGGPVLRFSVATPRDNPRAAAPAGATSTSDLNKAAEPGEADDDPFRPPGSTLQSRPPARPETPSGDGGAERPVPPSGHAPTDRDALANRYFGEGDDGEPAGERTQFIRKAYREIQQTQAATHQKERSRYRTLILAAVGVSVVATGYAGFLQYRAVQYRAQAQALFYQLKTYEVAVAQEVSQIQAQIAANPERTDSLTVNLDRALAARQQTAARYDRFVRDLGVYDGLSSEEELIYKTARNFGESELTIPPAFVAEVKVQINYWKNGGRFVRGVRHAQASGYDVAAVNALQRNGMPLEFFYLSLQESDFNTQAVGPATAYGYAKGAWQFIPETGRRYGLQTGPLVASNQFDPQDQRHNFPLAANAAAHYLHDIYIHLAQASGLLVCASYNWGEGRVKNHMRGIANDPEHRTYWRFLTEYRNRMPQETRDYVMKIFAAAVVGQNPRLFGIDMDPPVQVALAGGRGRVEPESAPASGRVARMGGSTLESRRADD